MTVITTSNRGQIVIPKAIRDALNIRPGNKISIRTENDYAILRPLPDDPVEAFCGIFQDKSSLTKALLDERRKDNKRESKKTTR